MKLYQEIGIWFLVLFIASLFFISISDILFPFIAGAIIAYFFDPLVDKLEKNGFSRALGSFLILIFCFFILIAFSFILMPSLHVQIIDLIKVFPKLLSVFHDNVQPFFDEFKADISPETLTQLKLSMGQVASKSIKWISQLVLNLWSGGLVLFNIISLLLVTPIVTFYLLRDWDYIIAKIFSWLPRKRSSDITSLIDEIDKTIAAFVRGQALVCATLAVFYAVGLTVIDLKSGLLVGIGAGFISFIPYLGATVGLLIGLSLALFQFSEIIPIVIVASIFIFGQGLESYFLTPKLVGDRVGLHPVWIMFGILVGGNLFGLVGVLIAVPVAAVIGVITRRCVSQYLSSNIYLGTN